MQFHKGYQMISVSYTSNIAIILKQTQKTSKYNKNNFELMNNPKTVTHVHNNSANKFRICSTSKERTSSKALLRPISLVVRRRPIEIETLKKIYKPTLKNQIKQKAKAAPTTKYQTEKNEQEICRSQNSQQISSPRLKVHKRTKTNVDENFPKEGFRKLDLTKAIKQLKRKDSQPTKQASCDSKKHKNYVKCSIQNKINQQVFENRRKKFTLKEIGPEQQQFWSQVKQSLIMATETFQNQESKQLRQMVQNLVTE